MGVTYTVTNIIFVIYILFISEILHSFILYAKLNVYPYQLGIKATSFLMYIGILIICIKHLGFICGFVVALMVLFNIIFMCFSWLISSLFLLLFRNAELHIRLYYNLYTWSMPLTLIYVIVSLVFVPYKSTLPLLIDNAFPIIIAAVILAGHRPLAGLLLSK